MYMYNVQPAPNYNTVVSGVEILEILEFHPPGRHHFARLALGSCVTPPSDLDKNAFALKNTPPASGLPVKPKF